MPRSGGDVCLSTKRTSSANFAVMHNIADGTGHATEYFSDGGEEEYLWPH